MSNNGCLDVLLTLVLAVVCFLAGIGVGGNYVEEHPSPKVVRCLDEQNRVAYNAGRRNALEEERLRRDAPSDYLAGPMPEPMQFAVECFGDDR